MASRQGEVTGSSVKQPTFATEFTEYKTVVCYSKLHQRGVNLLFWLYTSHIRVGRLMWFRLELEHTVYDRTASNHLLMCTSTKKQRFAKCVCCNIGDAVVQVDLDNAKKKKKKGNKGC